jgi:hypothetical protein
LRRQSAAATALWLCRKKFMRSESKAVSRYACHRSPQPPAFAAWISAFCQSRLRDFPRCHWRASA